MFRSGRSSGDDHRRRDKHVNYDDCRRCRRRVSVMRSHRLFHRHRSAASSTSSEGRLVPTDRRRLVNEADPKARRPDAQQSSVRVGRAWIDGWRRE